MRRRGKTTNILLWIVGTLAVLGVGLRFLAPRAMEPARVADAAAARAAGEELFASRDTTTLVVVAHPDDLEWWAGGTAGMLATHNRVVVVVATSGEKGNSGLVAGLGAVRERLQRQGGRTLGYSDVIFFREPDGGLAEAGDFPARVAEVFADTDPDVVITFDTDWEAKGYHHVDHEAAGRVTTRVARDSGGVTLYLMHTSAPDVICDYEPVKDAKTAAFATLTSYHDLVPLIGPLQKLLSGVLGPSAPAYGSKASYPAVGIEYGEVFRKVIVPAR